MDNFIYLLERYGNRQFIKGCYLNNKTKTGKEKYEENERGTERDKETLIKIFKELKESKYE